jgi:DNA repair protein RadA/Sms
VISAAQGQPVPIDLVAIGEVALSGDVRPVPMLIERAAEAARLGFHRLLVPAGSRARLNGRQLPATLVEVANLDEAITAMRRAGLSSIR